MIGFVMLGLIPFLIGAMAYSNKLRTIIVALLLLLQLALLLLGYEGTPILVGIYMAVLFGASGLYQRFRPSFALPRWCASLLTGKMLILCAVCG